MLADARVSNQVADAEMEQNSSQPAALSQLATSPGSEISPRAAAVSNVDSHPAAKLSDEQLGGSRVLVD